MRYLIVGKGSSGIEAIRTAISTPENWKLATDTGLCAQADVTPETPDAWCVVANLDSAHLEHDPTVIVYDRLDVAKSRA
jgi:hypothetical protein